MNLLAALLRQREAARRAFVKTYGQTEDVRLQATLLGESPQMTARRVASVAPPVGDSVAHQCVFPPVASPMPEMGVHIWAGMYAAEERIREADEWGERLNKIFERWMFLTKTAIKIAV